VKQRDPKWKAIRRHNVVPDKRSKLMEDIHEAIVDSMTTRCVRCGTSLASIVEVHGHSQCSVCGSVIDDCCQGECTNG
jgi:hypothetical protein